MSGGGGDSFLFIKKKTITTVIRNFQPVVLVFLYKGSGRGRLGAPRPPWRVRVECEEVFVLELSGTHKLHTINTTYQVADVRPSGLR